MENFKFLYNGDKYELTDNCCFKNGKVWFWYNCIISYKLSENVKKVLFINKIEYIITISYKKFLFSEELSSCVFIFPKNQFETVNKIDYFIKKKIEEENKKKKIKLKEEEIAKKIRAAEQEKLKSLELFENYNGGLFDIPDGYKIKEYKEIKDIYIESLYDDYESYKENKIGDEITISNGSCDLGELPNWLSAKLDNTYGDYKFDGVLVKKLGYDKVAKIAKYKIKFSVPVFIKDDNKKGVTNEDVDIRFPPNIEGRKLLKIYHDELSGIHYCDMEDAKKCKINEEVILVPDTTNEYDDTAIKVFSIRNKQIGWLKKDAIAKSQLFKHLTEGYPVKAYINYIKSSADGKYMDIDISYGRYSKKQTVVRD